jgi:dTDP-4-amino-4,6-dideoxygalactose transaminase
VRTQSTSSPITDICNSTMDSVHELAVNGGEPVRSAPYPSWPAFESEEIEAASAVLRSGKVNYWTGEQGRQFEAEFAALTHCEYAVAVANGSVGLEMALYALGIGPGDEVIVTSRSFIASASSIVLRGATPVFADVDLDSQNITGESVRQVLSSRTRAIIAVHLAGWPCDLDALRAISNERGIPVIEDCAQAHGAEFKGQPVGSLGDIASFSFCQDKIMSTGGEGGMVVTNDRGLWEKVWSFKDHGKSYKLMNQPQDSSAFRWVHESIGTNLRMTEVQSAIGRVLARKLTDSVEARRRHASRFSREFSTIPGLRVTQPGPDFNHSYYKYYVFIRPDALSSEWSRDRIVEAIRAEGVPCFTGSCSEIYLERAFAGDGFHHRRLPNAKELGETSLMFLVHPTLADNDINDACSAVRKIMICATEISASTNCTRYAQDVA